MLTALWLGLFLVFLLLSTIAVPSETQLVFSASMLVLIGLLYVLSRRKQGLINDRNIRLALIFLCSFLLIRYLFWRATETMPMQFGIASMICGLLLFLAELYTIITALLGYFINANPNRRHHVPLPADENLLPKVDIYIPTYNEDPELIRATVIAATQMDYPAAKLQVCILDDGGTEQKLSDPNPEKRAQAEARATELKHIAETYGALYITREKNVHAKAGNMNNALQFTDGELLAILDCDHIPTTDFVSRLVGFFLQDPKLFLVQTPHNFVSPDPLERNLDTYHLSPAENELFYTVMQPGLDSWGASFFCGSAAMLRRSVIDELGGISGQSITEDAETTLDALALGYTTAYYNRPLVSGLQPETYSGFVVQRVRWGQGMWQIFMLKNPWRLKGLKFIHKLLYTNFAFYWGFAFSRMVMLLAPPVFLIFGVNLCDTTSLALISYAAPALISSLIATQYFYGKVRWPFISQLYEVIQSFYVSIGLYEVLRKPRSPAFKVTPKGETLNANFLSAMSVPFYLILGANVIALIMGINKLTTQEWSQGAVSFVMFWAVLDMVLLLSALGVMLEKKQTRKEPRVAFRGEVRLRSEASGKQYRGKAYDVSAGGMGIGLTGTISREDFSVGETLQLEIPGDNLRFQARLSNCRQLDDDNLRLGLAYQLTTVQDERNAIRLAFGSSDLLISNNQRRHDGRSIILSLLTLISFAVKPGMDHLYLWLATKLKRNKPSQDPLGES